MVCRIFKWTLLFVALSATLWSCKPKFLSCETDDFCPDDRICCEGECRRVCDAPVCGDNILEGDEICDRGELNSDTLPNTCRTNCQAPSCGDDVKDMLEQCDGGAGISYGSCSSQCAIQCDLGYKRQGHYCVDDLDIKTCADEMKELKSCVPNASCDDSSGVALCVCNAGYQNTGGACEGLPESCVDAELNCGANEYCLVEGTSASCACAEDYVRQGDECVHASTTCAETTLNCATENHFSCTIVDGLSTCACDSGYVLENELCVESSEGDDDDDDDDDDDLVLPTLSIDDVEAVEGQGSATFTITLSEAAEAEVLVDYGTADGSATAGTDYVALEGTLTFAPDETEKTLSVVVLDDTVAEDAQTLSLVLSDAVNALIPEENDRGTLTITDNDVPPALSIANATALESAEQTIFSVTLSEASEAQIRVDFTNVDGTASAGMDYEELSGTLIFNPGDTDKIFTVSVLADNVDEHDEVASFILSGAQNASILDDTGILTIVDDDEPPALSIANGTFTEGNTGVADAPMVVSLSAASEKVVNVDYESTGGSAGVGSDYSAVSGTLTFATGATQAIFNVEVHGDDVDEEDQSVELTLSNPEYATLAIATATLTIMDNDEVPTLSISDVNTADESATDWNVNVVLSMASEKEVSVSYSTSDDSASQGHDYSPRSGTLTFVAGDVTESFSVSVLADDADEFNETVTLTLTSPVNASIDDATGILTITDDDDPPSLSIEDVSVSEGAGSANVSVTLSQASGKEVTVAYETSDGAANAANAGSDYSATSGTLTFEAGDVEEIIPVSVLADDVDEADESVTLTLSQPNHATIALSSAVLTIVDNDAPPSLSIDDVTINEGDSGTSDAIFTVTLSAASEQTVTVDYATSDDSATAPDDYIALSDEMLTFASGETSKIISVSVVGEDVNEVDESANLTLSNPQNASIADATGILTISDDDAPPIITFLQDESISEGDSGTSNATFTVTLNNPSASVITVDYATSNAKVSFTQVIEEVDAGSGLYPLSVGDLSGDGKPDILSSYYDNEVGWMEHDAQEDPTWADIEYFGGTGDKHRDLRMADMDGDGDLDVVSGAEDGVRWYRNNNGDGSSWSAFDVDDDWLEANSIHMGDLDGDGDLDIVAGKDNNNILWYENNLNQGHCLGAGDPYTCCTGENEGTCTWHEDYLATSNQASDSRDLHVADVDGDGDLDVVSVNGDNWTGIFWYKNDGDASVWNPRGIAYKQNNWGSSAYYLNGASEVDLGDVDGDGDLDAISHSSSGLHWLENLGEPEDGGTSCVGKNDPYTCCRQNPNTNADWCTGSLGWRGHHILVAAATYDDVHMGDMDLDGDLDVVYAQGDEVSWLENLGDVGDDGELNWNIQTITINSANIDCSGEDNPYPCCTGANEGSCSGNGDWTKNLFVADLDLDGDLDVVSAHGGSNDLGAAIIWYESDAAQINMRQVASAGEDYTHKEGMLTFTEGVTSQTIDVSVLGNTKMENNESLTLTLSNPSNATLEDVTGTITDISATLICIDDDATVFSNSATEQIPSSSEPDSPMGVSVGDLDGDGDLDLVSASSDDHTIAWYANNGDASTWTASDIVTDATGAMAVRIADLDGDGDLDMVSAASGNDTIAWYANSGDASGWTPSDIAISADNPQDLAVGDLDGDGDLDVVSASLDDHTIAWYENSDSSGDASTWVASDIVTDATGAMAVRIADLDGDGDLDVVSAASGNDTIAWYENSGDASGWTATAITASADGASDVHIADLNSDGHLDIVSVSCDDLTLAWYEHDGAADPSWSAADIDAALPGTDCASGGPAALSTRDVDLDGDLDIILGSSFGAGLYWFEHDGAAEPSWTRHELASTGGWNWTGAEDMDGDGDLDIIAPNTADDKIYLWKNDLN